MPVMGARNRSPTATSGLVPLLALVSLLGLAGCASTELGHGMAADPTRDWIYEPANKDEPAKLAYGVLHTDDVNLLLWCERTNHRVQFTPVGADDERFKHMVLQSLDRQLELSLSQKPERGSEGDAPLNAPLLAAFRTSARLSMILDGKRQPDLAASSVRGRQQIQEFFAACG